MTAQRQVLAVIAVILLLVAGALRFYRIGYGDDHLCLAVPEEYWLYDVEQVSSLYAWDVTPRTTISVEDLERSLLYPRERTALVGPDTLLLARLAGALLGIVVVALTLHLAWSFQATWWWIAGLFVAVAPWFVSADRWAARFDPALLAVAVSGVALRRLYRHPSAAKKALTALPTVAALSLLLTAPPLWWVAVGLLLLQPQPTWRLALFTSLAMAFSLPAIRSPLHWLNAAVSWDSGATAACVWALLALSLYRFPRLSLPMRAVLTGVTVISGLLSLYSAARLPAPTTAEWQLIGWLQERIPDGATVRYDSATWPLAPVVSCPLGAHLTITAQPTPPLLPSLPGDREALPADYIVTTRREDVSHSSYVHDLGNGFYVGRELALPNPVDIRFGDLLYVIGHQLITPDVRPGDLVDVRLDYQATGSVTEDALAHSAFIHVIVPGQPAEKIMEYTVPLVQEFHVFGPRQLVLNDHYRFTLPDDTPPGTYEVIFGIFNANTGERLRWLNGDTLSLGPLQVRSG
jgi:type IV secretory pathway TrbD component